MRHGPNSKTLGIAVTTRGAMPHLLGLAQAAKAADVNVEVFLTGEGVLLTQEQHFAQVIELARVGVCEVSFRAAGLLGRWGKKPAGLVDKDFVTQIRNAELVDLDAYVVL